MNEVNHTPGPWTAKRINNSTGETLYHIHMFVEPSVCGMWAPPGNIEAKANAHLIAAAPELLAACEAAKLAFRAIGQREKDYSYELRLLNEAIAKAKGLASQA